MTARQFEAIGSPPKSTRFPLIDERVEHIAALAKQRRAAYIAGLFTSVRDWLAEYRRSVRAIAPTSLIRRAPQV